MNTKQFRIDNIVNIRGYDVEYHPVKITSIMPDEVWVELIGKGEPDFSFSHLIDILDIKPIPLTEEILLKCGITKWINTTFEIRKNLDDTFSIYAWVSGKSIFICHLKYLHELQNVIPFLTNEELTVNL